MKIILVWDTFFTMSYYLLIKQNMKDKIYQFTYHPTSLNRKPEGAAEKNLIYQNMVNTGITIQNVCKYIGNGYGYTFTPNLYSNNKPSIASFKATSGFFLDFDLDSNPEEILSRFNELNIFPNFWYSTFSDTPTYKKFRVAILLDREIANLELIGNIYSQIFYHFPADIACRDAARIFYGGKEVTFLTDKPVSVEHLLNENTWKVKKAQLKYDSLKPVKLLYTNNKFTGNKKKTTKTYSLNQAPEFEFLNKLKNNDCDFSIISEKVKVFKIFITLEKRFDYLVLFGLATNLHWLQGGMLLLKKTMDAYNSLHENSENANLYYDRHFEVIKQVNKYKLFPQSLVSFSPYSEDEQNKNLISCVINPRGVVFTSEAPEKISLEEGERLFEKVFNEALISAEHITIIKAPVGIGKSQTLKNMQDVAICLPTHKLKEELYRQMTVECKMVPELPKFENASLNNTIHNHYRSGLRSAVLDLLRIIANNDSNDSQLAKQYLGDLEIAKSWKGTLLTTHERSLHQEMQQNILIYDEDCIHSLISQKSFLLNDLGYLIINYPDLALYFKNLYEELVNAEAKKMHTTKLDELPIHLLIEKLKSEPLLSNLIEFFSANKYYKEVHTNKKGQSVITIFYAKFNNFPENKKIIILSATSNLAFYQNVFKNKIKTIEIPTIKNKGKVVQHTKYSNSRQSIKKRDKVDLLKKIATHPVITFMSESKELNKEYSKIHGELNIYYGNTRGYNELKGKDLIVIGTPHINPIVYYFHAEYMGIDINNISKKMDYQTVHWKGMQFKFQTFDNQELRNIQLNLIEGELIQAVGRARTIRTEAEVNVFSNLPLLMTDTFHFE
jgi:hypothetical protein